MIKMGCFGSVVAFSPSQEVCQECEVQKLCSAEVFRKEESTLQAIERKETERLTDNSTLFHKERYDINDLPEAAFHRVKRFFVRRKNFILKPKVDRATPRAEKDYQKMLSNGIKFDMIKEQKNPFKGGKFYEFMMHTVDCLHEDKFITAKDVAIHFKKKEFGTSDSGRRTMAHRALKILELANVAKNENQEGTYCLS
ncbi:MAG: hypothetical protein NXH70_02470 [Hyphomonas sp.]|nr:hypothetical protein [Hyphomonas sp.]